MASAASPLATAGRTAARVGVGATGTSGAFTAGRAGAALAVPGSFGFGCRLERPRFMAALPCGLSCKNTIADVNATARPERQTMPSPLAEPLPWDLVSSDYATAVVPIFEGYARRAWSLASPPPGARVADVACGPGTLAACAVAEGAEVDALDFSPAMIAALEARGLPRVRPAVGDGQALPWPDTSFDAAFSMFGLMFFPDRARGFRELARVLVPGGRAVVSSWYPPSAVPQLMAMYAAMMPPGAPAPSAPPEPPLSRPEHYTREMGEAGFVDVEVVTHVEALASPSMSELFAGFLKTTAPMCLLRQRVGDVAFSDMAARARDALVERFGDGPQEVAMPAWIAVART